MAWIDPIVAVLVIAAVLGLVRGGHLANLAEVHLRSWWLLFVGLGMQIVADLLPDDRSWSQDVAVTVTLVAYGPLIVVVWINREHPGMWLAAVGILMNFSVIVSNFGMPVSPEAAVLAGADPADLTFDAKHVLLDSSSRLVFLADIIPLRFLRQVVSLGDVFLAVGLGQFLESEVRRPLTLFRHGDMGRPGSAAPGP